MQATPLTDSPRAMRGEAGLRAMRSGQYRPRRAAWPGLVGVAVIAAGMAAAVAYRYDDKQPLGAVSAPAASTVGDAAATMKPPLANDSAPMATKVQDSTLHGAVRIEGPARAIKARPRTAVLATAPGGAAHVDPALEVPAPMSAPTPQAAPLGPTDPEPGDQ